MEDSGAVIAEFENECKHAVAVQRELLTEILYKNSSCEYLQRHGAPLDLESFKSQVPVVSYDDILQDIQRVANGCTQPILCTDPIVQFARSSGTSSGKHKLIPQTLGNVSVRTKTFHTSLAYRNKYFSLNSGLLSMSFLYSRESSKTTSGLVVGSTTTNYYKTEAFKQHPVQHSSPHELIAVGADWRQTTYCHLLCGLLKRQKVGMIHALFAFGLFQGMVMLQSEWKNLCRDITTGTLNTKLINNQRLRSIMSEVLRQELEKQNSGELAQEISSICSMESWDGIIPLLWPQIKYLHTVVTGAMHPYVPALRKYAGNLPLVGFDYASSEGFMMGVNTNPTVSPENVVFTLSPFSVFFEFIPMDGNEESIVGVEGVQVGKQYELVITNNRGLYRYKVEDVIKIVGFLHKAPQMVFSYRRNAVLSISTERVDEQELQKAVMGSTQNLEVANFTSYTDFESEESPHYVIFCELRWAEDYSKHEALQEACEKMDKSFHNIIYLSGRVNKSIGPLELVLVKQGTFEKLMDQAVQNGASPGQYKTPRCVTTPTMLELLKKDKVESYKSLLILSYPA